MRRNILLLGMKKCKNPFRRPIRRWWERISGRAAVAAPRWDESSVAGAEPGKAEAGDDEEGGVLRRPAAGAGAAIPDPEVHLQARPQEAGGEAGPQGLAGASRFLPPSSGSRSGRGRKRAFECRDDDGISVRRDLDLVKHSLHVKLLSTRLITRRFAFLIFSIICFNADSRIN